MLPPPFPPCHRRREALLGRPPSTRVPLAKEVPWQEGDSPTLRALERRVRKGGVAPLMALGREGWGKGAAPRQALRWEGWVRAEEHQVIMHLDLFLTPHMEL